MKTLKFSRTMILLATVFQLYSCNGSPSSKTDHLRTGKAIVQDSIKSKTLVITSVISPWYAWRGLVVNKMKETIPQYQAIPGLNQKIFCITENKTLFGGIYFWKTKQDAEKWFNKEWFDRTEKKYGEKGIVHYYQIEKKEIIEDLDPNDTDLWTVLSYSEKQLLLDKKVVGLLDIVYLKDATNKNCVLTVWKNKEVAKKYFKDKQSQNVHFDSPILIQNSK
jgi:heme-degrading monooxygenase HmoA